MIRLAQVIETFEADFLAQYRDRLSTEHLRALAALRQCRTHASPKIELQCPQCEHRSLVPHSCGHRHCPHCQHHDSQQWLERQSQRQVPAAYFLLTFTLPAEFRALAWAHQQRLYDLLIGCAWQSVHTFSRNHRQLQGTPGAIAVLHTNTRRLDYHPHVHLVMPAAAIDGDRKRWRTTRSRGAKARYLFNHKALAKVFRAKMLAGIEAAGLALPPRHPGTWVVDCKSVGSGEKALVYLGRYLYRGVIRERYQRLRRRPSELRHRDAKIGRSERRTVCGAHFLAGPAACCPRLSAGAQFRLSASELQAPDRAAARCWVHTTFAAGNDPPASARAVRLLRGCDDHPQNPAAAALLRRHAASDARHRQCSDRVSIGCLGHRPGLRRPQAEAVARHESGHF
jgi:hypothetical protein